MKLLVITDSYPPHHSGGYELRCKDIVDGLIKRGHEVKVITTRCPTQNCKLHKDEQRISRVLYKKSETPLIYSRIYHDLFDIKFIRSEVDIFKPDLVYLSHLGDLSDAIFFHFSDLKIPIVFDDGGLGMVLIAKLFKRGLYFHKNENDIRIKKYLKNITNTIIYLVSGHLIPRNLTWPLNIRILFNSIGSREFAKDNGIPIENARVIYSGIDPIVFQCKSNLGFHNPIRILVPGRIGPTKGTKDAISLLSLLNENNVNATLTIVGNVDSQPYFDEIILDIRKSNLESFISIRSMVGHDELARLYRESDVCFFPSYQKYGLSRVPLEAMSSGCLVISYGNESSNEIIQDGETGFIVRPGDISATASIIIEVLADPTRYQKVVQSALLNVEQNFSLAAYLDRVEIYITSSSQR